MPHTALPARRVSRSTLKHLFRRAAAALGASVAVAGLLGLGVRGLVPALPGWVSGTLPTANTSLCLVLLGAVLTARASRPGGRLRLGAAAAGVTTLIALLTLSEYITGRSLGIDNPLGWAPPDGSAFPGRMSVIGSFALLLLGFGAMLQSLRPHHREVRLPQALAVGGLLLGLLALLGLIWNAHFFLRFDPSYGAIAPVTIWALLGAAVGLLLLQPSGPVMEVISSTSTAGREARILAFVYLPGLLIGVALIAAWEASGRISPTEAASISGLALLVALLLWGWRTFRVLDHAEKEVRRVLLETEQARENLRDEVIQRTAALTTTTIRAEGARARLHAVMESAPDLIAAIDRDYRYVVVNQAYVESVRINHGVTVESGMHYDDLFRASPGSFASSRESWRRALAGERHTTVDDIRQVDRGTRIYERVFGPVIDSDGRVIGAVGVKRDITERRLLEQEAARNRTLVEQRNRDLETLLHVVSHDLKEPLRSIESFSRLLSARHTAQLDDKGLDYLDRVVKATGRMGQLLEEIQLLSRARQAEPAPAEVDGEEVVREVLARLDGAIRETGSTILVEDPMPRLGVQRVWATQALYNLVANALKFRQGDRPAEIAVVPWYRDARSGFRVLDRGPGVPQEQRERIFQLFQRGVGREIPGTGAGLAIVRQIAERHGGEAWVEEREGGGSVFTVTFATGGGQAA